MEDTNRPSTSKSQSQNTGLDKCLTQEISARTQSPGLKAIYITSFNTEIDVVNLLNILSKTELDADECWSALEGLAKFTVKAQGASWRGLRLSIFSDENLLERFFQVLLKICHVDNTRNMAEASQLLSINYHLFHQRLKLSLQKEIVLFFMEMCSEPYYWDMDDRMNCVAQAAYYVFSSSEKYIFRTLFNQVESNTVLESIYFILKNRSSVWPGYFMLTEMLNIVTAIVRLFTKKVEPLCVLEEPSLWLEVMFPLMFVEEASVRRAALTALENLHNYLPSKAFCSSAEWRKIKLTFETKFCQKLVNYARENQSGWTRVWRFILSLIMEDSVTPRNNTLFNQILVVEEKAFKAHCCDTRLLAFSCWKILISKFLDPNSSDAARWLKLFLQPLTATNCKTDILSHSKLDMYWEIICKLSPKFEKFADQVLPHFLRFCFGPLGELRIERNTTDILLSPGRRFHSLHIPCASALAQMLLVKCDSVSTDVTFALPHLKESLLSNPKLFVHLSELIFLSVCECTLILSSLEDLEKYGEDDLKQRSIYCELIWNNLLHHVKSALALPRVKDDNNDQISVLMKKFFNALNLMFEHAKGDSQVAGTCLSPILKSILMGSNSLSLEDLLIPSFVDTKVEVIYGTPLRFLVSLVMSTMLLSTQKYKKIFLADLDYLLKLSVAANAPTYLHVSLTVGGMLDELMKKEIVSSVLLTMISATWCAMMRRFIFLLLSKSENIPDIEGDGVWIHNVLEFPARYLHRWNDECLASIRTSWKNVTHALSVIRMTDNTNFVEVYSETFYQLVPYMFKIKCVKDGPMQQASMLYMTTTLLGYIGEQYLLDQMSIRRTVPGRGVRGFIAVIVELSKYAGKEPVKANAFYMNSLLDCLSMFFSRTLCALTDDSATFMVVRECLVPIKNAMKYVQTGPDVAESIEYVDRVLRMWKAYVTPLLFLKGSSFTQVLSEISTAWKEAIWKSSFKLAREMYNMSMKLANNSGRYSEIIAVLTDNSVVYREQNCPQTDNDAASAQNQSSVPQQPGVSHSAMDNNRTPTLTHYQHLKIKNKDDAIPALYSDLSQESQDIICLSDEVVIPQRSTEIECIEGPVLQLPMILKSRDHMKANIGTFFHKEGVPQPIGRPVLMKVNKNISPASASSAPGRSPNIGHKKTLKYENKSKVLRTFQVSEKKNLGSIIERSPVKVHDCEKLIDTNMSEANVTSFDVNKNLDKNIPIELALRNVENECNSSGREGKDNQVGKSVIQTGYSITGPRKMQSELKKENKKNVHSEGKEENIPIKSKDSKFIVDNHSSVIDEVQISSISLSNLKRCQVLLKKLPLDITAPDTVYVQGTEGIITYRKKSTGKELKSSGCDDEQNYYKPTGPSSAALDIEGDGCPDNNTHTKEYPSPSSAKILLHTIGDNSTVKDVLHTYNGCSIKGKQWVRHVYDPCSTPVCKSSLKRKCDMTPPSGSKCKKRRVNFLEPEVTKCLIFNKYPDEPQGKIPLLPRRSCRGKDNDERNRIVGPGEAEYIYEMLSCEGQKEKGQKGERHQQEKKTEESPVPEMELFRKLITSPVVPEQGTFSLRRADMNATSSALLKVQAVPTVTSTSKLRKSIPPQLSPRPHSITSSPKIRAGSTPSRNSGLRVMHSYSSNVTTGVSKKCRAQIGLTYNTSNTCDPTVKLLKSAPTLGQSEQKVNSITTSLPGTSSMQMKFSYHVERNLKTLVASPPVSQESQGSVHDNIPEMPVCKRPIYAPLAYCKDPVDVIIKKIFSANKQWERVVMRNLHSHGIFTIGDMCKLPEKAIEILPLVEPKLKSFVGVLQKYENRKEIEMKEKSDSGLMDSDAVECPRSGSRRGTPTILSATEGI